MISYVSGNLFESPAQTLVNTVNTVGVMGKGVALRFKEIYPAMFRQYRELCEKGLLKIGTLHVYRTPHKIVVNFPTKEHWRRPSKVQYIESGLENFVRSYEKAGIHSVAFPPLGCGNGELNFEDVVRPVMEKYLESLPIRVYIYAPHKRSTPPEHRDQQRVERWLRSTPRDLPFEEVWSDLMSLLGTRRELATLTRGGRFEAQSVKDASSVRIWTAGRTLTVNGEDFAEHWKQLREHGILTPGAARSRRQQDASYIFAILAELPYLQKITVGEDFDAFTYTPAHGLQLVPTLDGVPEQNQMELI